MTLFSHHDKEACQRLFNAGHNQIIYRTLVADTQTAVGAMMKLMAKEEGNGQYHCLLESVEGGETRGRFSVIGIKPDLIWRAYQQKIWINRQAHIDVEAFELIDESDPFDSLRRLIKEAAMPSTAPLPPMAAGLFGYLGYDMIRHIETLPQTKANDLNIDDAVMMRPSIVAIFDRLKDTITLAYQIRTAAFPDAETGWQAAIDALNLTEKQLHRPLPPAPNLSPMPPPDKAGEMPLPKSNMPKQRFLDMVEQAKKYIAAGDIFQTVLSQRFSIPFHLPSFALYRSLRRLNPSPFLFHFALHDMSIIGSSPEILVRLREGEVTIRPIAGTRPRGGGCA